MTNFLSEQDFQAFLNSLRQLLESNQKSLAQTNRSLSMPIDGFIELFRLVYGSALRISESLTVYPNDIDFDKKLISLPHTKTGFKKCKCARRIKQDNGSWLLTGNKDCSICKGRYKLRKTQRTTIHPHYSDSLRSYLNGADPNKPIFSTNRFTLWSYAKKAGKLAGLNVFEEQKDRLIEGVWTHLFRKSRAKQMMRDIGPDEKEAYVYELLKIKLRHSREDAGRDVTQRYSNIIGQKLGLNDLLEWEKKHYG